MSRREAEVELGAHRYTIVPQKIGRLRRKLRDAFSPEDGEEISEDEALEIAGEIAEATEDGRGEDIVEQLGNQAHTVLEVFVPNLMPKYEWLGYGSQEAQEKDDYDDVRDNSPDIPQIVDALAAAMHVNKLDLLKQLKDLVSPDFRQAMVQKVVADFLMNTSSNSSSPAIPATTTTAPTQTAPTWEMPGSDAVVDGYELASSLTEPIGASAG